MSTGAYVLAIAIVLIIVALLCSGTSTPLLGIIGAGSAIVGLICLVTGGVMLVISAASSASEGDAAKAVESNKTA
jgi:hypothetical protein